MIESDTEISNSLFIWTRSRVRVRRFVKPRLLSTTANNRESRNAFIRKINGNAATRLPEPPVTSYAVPQKKRLRFHDDLDEYQSS